MSKQRDGMDDNRFGDQAKNSINAATEMAGDLADKTRTAAAQAGSAIQEVATQAGMQVADAAAKTSQQGSQAAADFVSKQGAQAADYVTKQGAQVAEYVRSNAVEQPWTTLLIAGAIGYVIAYWIHGR